MPRTCAYVLLYGKRDFADVINDPEMGNYPGPPGCVQCNDKGLYKREAGGQR